MLLQHGRFVHGTSIADKHIMYGSGIPINNSTEVALSPHMGRLPRYLFIRLLLEICNWDNYNVHAFRNVFEGNLRDAWWVDWRKLLKWTLMRKGEMTKNRRSSEYSKTAKKLKNFEKELRLNTWMNSLLSKNAEKPPKSIHNILSACYSYTLIQLYKLFIKIIVRH